MCVFRCEPWTQFVTLIRKHSSPLFAFALWYRVLISPIGIKWKRGSSIFCLPCVLCCAASLRQWYHAFQPRTLSRWPTFWRTWLTKLGSICKATSTLCRLYMSSSTIWWTVYIYIISLSLCLLSCPNNINNKMHHDHNEEQKILSSRDLRLVFRLLLTACWLSKQCANNTMSNMCCVMMQKWGIRPSQQSDILKTWHTRNDNLERVPQIPLKKQFFPSLLQGSHG